jgi:hypothetical protein
MAHQSLPVTPNPPRYFLARRIRVNLAITVPATDAPGKPPAASAEHYLRKWGVQCPR